MESIGTRLRRLREERSYAQRDITGPGVSAAYVSLIERGLRTPSMKAIRVLARNLGVSVEYLETGDPLRSTDARSMRLLDAELRLRLDPDPSDLERDFRELYWEAVEVGDTHAATRSLVGLGFAAEFRGDYEEVVHRLRRATQDPWLCPTAHVGTYVALARAYVQTGRGDDAVELLRTCLAAVRTSAPDDAAAFVKYSTYLACALNDRGEREEAQEVLDSATAAAESAGDSQAHVHLLWSEARLARDRGQASAALETMHRAIGLLEASENSASLGRAHLVCGEILLSCDRLEEAEAHLERADRLLGATADTQLKAVLLTERARFAARIGSGQQGIGLARRALSMLNDSEQTERGRAHWALAEGLAACRRFDEAEQEFDRAHELLRREESRYLERLAQARERALSPASSPS